MTNSNLASCRQPARHPHRRRRRARGRRRPPRARSVVRGGHSGRPPGGEVRQHAPRRHRRLGVDAGRLAGGPTVLPRLAGATQHRHLRLRVPQRHRHPTHTWTADEVAAQRGTPRSPRPSWRSTRRTTIYAHADQPRPVRAAGPRRRAHDALARLRQRHPAVRRRPRAVARGADRARLHLLLPAARRRHLHVPLPLRGRRARADGHDRHRLRPAEAEQDRDRRRPGAARKYAYNDGDGSTRYDREFAFMLTEIWAAAHYRDAHIQVSDWTDYDASFWLLNGRATPTPWRPNGDPLVDRRPAAAAAVPADLAR